MNKAQRMQAIKTELTSIHKVTLDMATPYIEQREALLSEYWNEGYTTEEIANETGYQRTTIRRWLTELELDWREREQQKKEPDFEIGSISL